ncbi:MAG: hypothetical protein AABX29_09235 [Nanoarchaeota archaeon]
MKKSFSLMAMVMLIISTMPIVLGVDVGTGIGIIVTPEEFEPLIWGCDSRTVYDDTIEPGRSTIAGEFLQERTNNYAFEGEQIEWEVLVMDKNKIEQIQDVVGTIGSVQGVGNDIEVECIKDSSYSTEVDESCNARILEEDLTGDVIDSNTQQYYKCTLTVETPDSMYGEYFITVEAMGTDGSVTMDENEFWFLNPVIALSVDGDLEFENVRPGTVSYSDTLLVGNDGDDGSGVLLDMFISGTDFYDSSSSGARCPTTNRLKLGDQAMVDSNNGPADGSEVDDGGICNINLQGTETGDHLCYYATQGAYSTQNDPRKDPEGYVGIHYADQFKTDFYNDAEIIAPTNAIGGGLISLGGVNYFAGNVLTPGSEIAMTFKLGLPEPCVGNFDSGDIFFWGEAI